MRRHIDGLIRAGPCTPTWASARRRGGLGVGPHDLVLSLNVQYSLPLPPRPGTRARCPASQWQSRDRSPDRSGSAPGVAVDHENMPAGGIEDGRRRRPPAASMCLPLP